MSKNPNKRPRKKLTPHRLASKIKDIRNSLGLTQEQIWSFVNPAQAPTNYSRISQYENNVRVPSLREIWNYARLAGLSVEVLADDALNLTDNFYESFRFGTAGVQEVSRLPETAPNPAKAKEKSSVSDRLLQPIENNLRITNADTDDDVSISDRRGAKLPAPVGITNKSMTIEDKGNAISAQPDELLAAVVLHRQAAYLKT